MSKVGDFFREIGLFLRFSCEISLFLGKMRSSRSLSPLSGDLGMDDRQNEDVALTALKERGPHVKELPSEIGRAFKEPIWVG